MNISVIVPIYNNAEYIERCVKSVLAQTYTDFELLLIDDGSTDNSYYVCKEYEHITNIRIFHQENQGPSSARNFGIKESRGKYVFFLDSDDFISNDCLETLINLLNKYNANIAAASFAFFDDKGLIESKKGKNKEKCYTNMEACRNLLYGRAFFTSSCNILLEKKIALDNLFPIGKYHEDELTTFRYLLSADRAVFSTKLTYYYYQRAGSIMHVCGQPVIDAIQAADNYVIYMSKHVPSLLNAAKSKKYSSYYVVLRDYSEMRKVYPNEYQRVRKYLQINKWNALLSPFSSINTKIIAAKVFLKRY